MKTGFKIGKVVLTCVLICSVASPVFAVESDKTFTKTSEKAIKATVNYPANLTNETVNIVGKTAKDTAEVVIDTVKVTGETFTGDAKKAPEIITTPVRETGETINSTTVGIVSAPVTAGKDTVRQN
ncbi:MAG: hypothetical protein ABIH85_06375 [Candidatus Omnitrophota bacterium]